MLSKFWILTFVTGFYFLSNAQQNKLDHYLQEIKSTGNILQKEKIFDSLVNVLYKCNCNAQIKHQYIDKLTAFLQDQKKLQKLYFKTRLIKSKLYFRQSEFEKAIDETEKLKNYCKKINYPLGSIRAAILQGRILNRIDRYDEALKNYKYAMSLIKKHDTISHKDLQKILINLYANMARLYMNMHQDSLADVYHIKTVNLAYKIHDYERISFFNNILGWKYFATGDYKTAEKYFIKALKDSAKIKFKVYNISNHHALGVVYEKLKEPEKALYHDSIALDFFKKTNNNTFISSIYNNIAKVYLQTKQFDKALESVQKAIEVAEKHKIIDKLVTAKITLAKILTALKKYDKAYQILLDLTANNTIKQKFNIRHKSSYYKLLSDIFLAKNDYEQAFKYLRLHLKFSDSINKRRLRILSGTETKYQNMLLRTRMKAEQQELLREKRQKQRLFYGVLFLTGLIFVGLFFILKSHKKYVAQQQELKQLLQKIEKLNASLFQKEQSQDYEAKRTDFREFIKEKYGIHKIEILDVWESIAKGLSQSEYVRKNKVNENTVKAWRKELYKKLKEHTGDTKFSDYKAVIEYYKSLRDFDYFYSK